MRCEKPWCWFGTVQSKALVVCPEGGDGGRVGMVTQAVGLTPGGQQQQEQQCWGGQATWSWGCVYMSCSCPRHMNRNFRFLRHFYISFTEQ